MSERIVWLNGEFLPEREAHISVRDRGFLLGDGCFETMSCYVGTLFRLREHMARLGASLELARIPAPRPLDEIAEAASALPGENGLTEARVRITISRGLDCEVGPFTAANGTVVITAVPQSPPPKEVFEAGWRAVICKNATHPGDTVWARAKSTSRLWIVLAAAEAEEAGVDEAILLDRDGYVVEGTRSNVFMVRGSYLITPPVDTSIGVLSTDAVRNARRLGVNVERTCSGALAGITRAEVVGRGPDARGIAERLGLGVEERMVGVEELMAADECFLTRTTAGVAPISEIDGRRIGPGGPGLITLQIADAYEKIVQSVCGPAARVRER
jgi:branched-chain amino acid aminotransferase